MQQVIASANKFQDFGSYDALAKALIETFPEQNWQLKPRSLGAKLGELDRGNVKWWMSRQSKARCVAELLEIPPEDLAIHAESGSRYFSFEEFPEFPPLDLKREDVARLAREQLDKARLEGGKESERLSGWVDRREFQRGGPWDFNWLVVPDDLRRRLLFRQIQAVGVCDVLEAETLAELGELLVGHKPLVVCVAHDGGADDLNALARRPRAAGLLVIAPFMLPKRKESSSGGAFGWEERTLNGVEGEKFHLSGEGVRRWILPALPDWRARLLEWVELQLNLNRVDTSFSAQAIGAWLDKFDPLSVWFRTTSDLMQLCRVAHLESEKRLPNPGDANAGHRLTELLFARGGIQANAYKVKQLSEARWARMDVTWDDVLSLSTWLDLSGPGAALVSREELDEIVTAKNIGDREKAADRVAALLEAGNPEALLRSGLLIERQRGCFDFRHRSFAALLVRDRLMEQIASQPLSAWAGYCFDSGRRLVIDAALDAASMASLLSVADRLLSGNADTAEVIGASEALFVAIGKRIVKGASVPEALFPVARMVIKRLDLSERDTFGEPWSRPSASSADQLDWAAACWAWSLLPDAKLDGVDSWLFPGWATEVKEAAWWLQVLTPDDKEEEISSALGRFLEVLRLWAKEIDQPEMDWPPLLLLPFLIKAALGGVNPNSAWWKVLIGKKWAEHCLAHAFKAAGSSAASRLWNSFVAAAHEVSQNPPLGDKYNFPHLAFHYSPVRFWLLENLGAAEALVGLSDEERRYLGHAPELLPPELRGPLLASLLGCHGIQLFTDGVSFLERFGFHASSALEIYLDDSVLGWGAVQCLWRWSPERAVSLLAQRDTALEIRRSLLQECPESYFFRALDILSAESGLLEEEERLYWIRRYLPNAGAASSKALSLLRFSQ